MQSVQTRNLMIIGGAAGLLLLVAALWVLLQPPRGQAQSLHLLAASNPALDVRYHYDPNTFHPAPFDSRAEYPLRLDAKDWSLYAKRIQGAGALLVKQPQAVVYSFVNDAGNSVYTEFYKLQPEGETTSVPVQLGGQQILRQAMVLTLGDQSRGWPPFFPAAIIGDQANPLGRPDERADQAFGGIPEVEKYKHDQIDTQPGHGPAQSRAYLYSWALFDQNDLFFYQAVSVRPLSEPELQDAEAIIGSMEFDALLGAQSTPAGTPPAAGSTAPATPGSPASAGGAGTAPAPPVAPPTAPPAAPPADPGAPPATPGP